MTRYIQGVDRASLCFPEKLDDYISEDNPVRAMDAFIDSLDLAELGFERMVPAATGRFAYHPATLLKIYVYGHLHRVQSSRRLERETRINVEMMWLSARLMPDHKTISDFRKDNARAIIKVCAEFVQVCRALKLFNKAEVAIDGSKFKAVNHRDKNFTEAKMKTRLERVKKRIAHYLEALDKADAQEQERGSDKVLQLERRILQLDAEQQRLEGLKKRMLAMPDKQLSLTDPDSRSMATGGKGSGMVGYNVQTAVESEHHLIVAHEVSNVGSDRSQLYNMASQAREALGSERLTAAADRGYYEGEQIRACEEDGIEVYVAKPQTSTSKKAGRFSKEDFHYEAEADQYRCPAGKALKYRFTGNDRGKAIRVYWYSRCETCAIKAQCTTSKQRRVSRWEHEAVLERVAARVAEKPEMMAMRRQTVEHPYGTLKMWMGATHFLTTRLSGVRAEMSLHVLAYNFKRVLNILGTGALVAHLNP